MPEPQIRVLCVDDHAVVREGIAFIVDLQPDMKVIASAATGEQAVDLCRRHRPDVTLMDLQLPGMSGLEAIRTIRSEDAAARIIVLTMYQGDEDIFRALEAGAVTYLLKETLADDLIRVVREVHVGGHPILSDVAKRLAEHTAHPVLTRREREVLELVVGGMQNKEIAAALSISEETTHSHLKNLFAKLNVNHRTAAVIAALRRGIIHLR